MPPAKDCVYNNSLGVIAYNDSFDTNFIAALTPVVLYNGTNEFLMYPVEVIESNNTFGRIRNYYSTISTNPAVLHSNEVSIANYPISWIEDLYGEPPTYLNGSAIQDWYDACDPMRQHVLCDLLPSNSVPDYLTMLTNSVGYYTEGTNTNSVLSLYSNVIAVVQCSINAEDAELYLHAPDDILMLDVYRSTNLLDQYSWQLDATLEHTLDPLRYVANFDVLKTMYYSLGNGALDSDGDGLLDARELILFETDPDSADSDGDGLSDGEEILIYRLDPMNSDTDGDGVSDGEEISLGTSPFNNDTDNDGLSDRYETRRIIVMWGDSSDNKLDVPQNLPDIKSVACGGNHTLALTSEGTVVAWGDNTFHQCDVPTGLSNAIAISAGYRHSVALKSDGTVVAWGANHDEQCDVPIGLSGVVAIACGSSHALALKEDGSVVAWGDNSLGQCSQYNFPESLNHATSIAAGAEHSMALQKSWPYSYINAWGWNTSQQCFPLPPSLISSLESGIEIRAIAAGSSHSVALSQRGKVFAWGGNQFYQRNVPSDLSGTYAGVLAISASFNHTLALKSDRTVVDWGQKYHNVPEGLSDVLAIFAGYYHNAVLVRSKLNPRSQDTDGDLLPDGWEVKHGFDPLVANNLNYDSDGDGLSLFDEYRYVTDPNNRDTDGDRVWDGDEIPFNSSLNGNQRNNITGGNPNAGSNPNDGDDYGKSINCVTMLLTVGDPSNSNSERWKFGVFYGTNVIRHVDDGFGTPGSNEYSLVKGKEYTYKIDWVDHNKDYFDYDWQALINDLSVSGLYDGLYNTGKFIVEDPEHLLTTLYNGSEINEADGLEGRIIVPLSKISSDYDHSGVVEDSEYANTNETYNATGLVVPVGTNTLGMIELYVLPESMDFGEAELSVQTTGSGDIKIWTTPDRQPGTLLLSTLDSGMMSESWSVGYDDIPDTIYAEGINSSSNAGDISLILKFEYEGELFSAATQKISVVDMDMIPNFDRDGDIDSIDFDKLKMGEVYRFWINDDNDEHDSADSGNDVPGGSNMDWESDDRYLNDYTYVVDGIRDFVDFFPVYIKLNNALDVLPASQYDYILKHADSAVNVFINTGLSHEEADYHLYNKTFVEANHNADLIYIESDGYTFPADFLSAADAGEGVILVEGRAATTEPLILEVRHKQTGSLIFETEMPMSLSSVKNMYRFLNVKPGGVSSTDEPSNYPDSLCNDKNLFFLHGFKATEDSAPGWHAEFFKRLYWSGSNAKYWGVTWHSDGGTLTFLNYHLNVINAFEAGSNLWAKINYVPNKTFMAHSLGNMVVSSAVEDYGLDVDKYFMLNAAVPAEAYDSTLANTATSYTNYMLHEDWHGYLPKTWASNWHVLFDDSDNRSNLYWGGRFASVVDVAYNYYSSGDEVLEIKNSMPGILDEGLLRLNRYTWHKQEIYKGTHGLGSSDWAGWGFYRNALFQRYYTLGEANSLSNSVLRTAPVFKHDPSYLFQTNMTNAKVTEVLARGVPALSYPAGTAEIEPESNPNFSFDIESFNRDNGWPNRNTYNTRWLHSDIKNVAYVYNFEIFNRIVNAGELE